MADFVRLNGYDIKDAESRNQIQNINNNLNNQLYSTNNVAEIGHFEHSYGLQGGFIYNNLFYIYDVYSNDISGDFNIINLDTGVMTQQLNCNFGHGNDFVVVNGYVYCAPYSMQNVKSMKLLRAPMTNLASVEEYDELTIDELNCLYGVTKYDDDNLILAIRNEDYNIKSTRLFKYNITNKTYTEYTIDWNNFGFTSGSFPHPIEYFDNKLVMTMSAPEGVISFNLTDGTFIVNKVDYLPKYSPFGMELSEIEAICRYENFGYNYVIMAVHSYLGAHLIAYNLKGSAPISLIENITLNNYISKVIYADNTSTNIFETGSQTHPIKSVQRAQYLVNINSQSITINSLGNTITELILCKRNVFINLNQDVTILRLNGGADITISLPQNSSYVINDIGLLNNSKLTLNYGRVNSVDITGNSHLRTFLTRINTRVNLISPGGIADLSLPSDNPVISVDSGGNSLVKTNQPSKLTATMGGGSTYLVPGRMAVQS